MLRWDSQRKERVPTCQQQIQIHIAMLRIVIILLSLQFLKNPHTIIKLFVGLLAFVVFVHGWYLSSCAVGAILSGKARVKGRGSGSIQCSTTAVVDQQSSSSDLTRRALSGDPGWRGTVLSHNNANKYYGKWIRTVLPLGQLLPSSGPSNIFI